MKRILLPTTLVLLLAASCTGKKPQQDDIEPKPIDTLIADWDETSVPMPIEGIGIYNDDYEMIDMTMRHIYDNQEDSALYAPIAGTYHKLVCNGSILPIKFVGEQQNGKEWGSIISGQYAYCMKGLNYDEDNAGECGSGYAFSDSFLQSHEVIQLKYPETAAPKYLLDTLSVRYQNEALSGYTCAVSADEKIKIYSVQMQPKDGKCLGMRVISDNDSLIIYEEWAMEYNDMSAWHVDDGGEYYPFHPIALTRGEKGLDVFYYEGAPESSTYAALLLRKNKVEEYVFASYYNHIDYTPTPDPCELPEGSELKAELDGYKVWVHTDVQPSEDAPEGKYSVYYSKPESNDVYFVVTTGLNPNAFEKWDNEYATFVGMEDVLAADEAFLVKHPKWSDYYLIMQGCPDARNIFTYISYLPIETVRPRFRWIRTNSGFQGVDPSGEFLMFDNYSYYPEGGRYTIRKFYDFDFNMVKEEATEE